MTARWSVTSCTRLLSSSARKAAKHEHSASHLIHLQEHRLRNLEPECLRGLHVDDELELRWLLDGQVRGLGALEDLVAVDGGAPTQVRKARAVGHEPPCLHILLQLVHRWQPTLRRKGDDPVDVTLLDRVSCDEQRGGALPHHRGKRALQLVATAHFENLECHAQGSRSSLNLVEVGYLRWISRIPKESQARQFQYGLVEEGEPFCRQTRAKVRQARDVPTRLPKARDQAAAQRIASVGHDNGDRRCCPLGRGGCRRAFGYDDVHFEPDQLSREIGQSLAAFLGPSILEDNFLPFHVPEIAKPLPQWLPKAGVAR